MQCQKIISENGKDYLAVSVPTLPELFAYGLVSASGKSFVFRKWSYDKTNMSTYLNVKINQHIIKGRVLNPNHNIHSKDFVKVEFNGILLSCVKLSVSKPLTNERSNN